MKTRNFIFRMLIVATLVGQTGGCITARMYSGPERPRNEVAVLKWEPELFVSKVDGIATSRFWDTVEIHVLPGKHTIELGYYSTSPYFYGGRTTYRSVTNQCITFEALRGHTYLIYHPKSNLETLTWHPHITDMGIDVRDGE